MHIVIVALRRSGTTITWETFRQDKRFICFNEPFNPELSKITEKGNININYHKEFCDLYERDKNVFWEKYRSIYGIYEIQDGLSNEHEEYIRYLNNSSENTLSVFTRSNFKIKELKRIIPNSILIHLYRPPMCFATSIMLPSSGNLKRIKSKSSYIKNLLKSVIRNKIVEATFWNRQNSYNAWDYDSIIGSSPNSCFGDRLKQWGYDPEEIYQLPAIGKLMAFWMVNYLTVEKEGRKYFGNKFISINFNDFCRQPDEILSSIYNTAGLEKPNFDVSRIHKPNIPYKQDSREWRDYISKLKLPDLN